MYILWTWYVDVWTVDARLAFEYLLPILFTYLFNFLLFFWQQWYFIKWIFRFTLFNLHIYHSHAYHKDTTQHYIFIASNSLFQLNSIQFYLLSWAFAYFILLTRIWICEYNKGEHDFWRPYCLFLAHDVTLSQGPQINNITWQKSCYYHYHEYTRTYNYERHH